MNVTRWDSSWPRLLDRFEEREICDFWQERFGIPPSVFAPFLMMTSSRTVYILRRSESIAQFTDLRIAQAGLPFIRKVAGHFKPTTASLQLFGALALSNSVDLTGRLCEWASKGEIKLELDTSPGYVIIKTGEAIWGAGLYLEPSRLLCRLPKAIKRALSRQGDHNLRG